jgi:hypothetical protein
VTAPELYRELLVDDPERNPEWRAARWYDFLWLLVPLAGPVMLLVVVRERYKNN